MVHLNDLGMIAAFAAAFLLLYRYRSIPRVARLPKQAFLGAGIVFAGQFLALLGVPAVALYFTPIEWTGYILWIDGAIYSLRGKSLLRTYPAEFAWLAFCSIPLWLLFEAYNLRLANWIYVGLPENWLARQIGYGWAFATIWPGIFETAMLLRALDWNAPPPASPQETAVPRAVNPLAAKVSFAIGALLLTIPVLVPPAFGAYLFGAVWLGFIFLLEPVNLWTGRPSLWRDLRRGDSSRLRALLWAGMLCGLLWEFWNWHAGARWFYIVPILQDWKLFAMPLPGYLGFPAFAVECFVMYSFLVPVINIVSMKRGVGIRLRQEALEL